jgi:hypothetical protein
MKTTAARCVVRDVYRSAVNELNDAFQKAGAASPLRKLGGMIMFAATYGWSNVEFIRTTHALQPILDAR